VKAAVLVALTEAAAAGALPRAAGAGTAAPGFVSVGTGALGERRERGATVSVEAELEHFVLVAVVEEEFAGVGLLVDGIESFRVEPAGGGHVGGGLRRSLAQTLTLLLVTVLVVAPDLAEGGGGGGAGLGGAEELAVGRLKDFGDGLGGDCRLLRGPGAGGAREGEGRDLAGIEDFAGADGIDGSGEDALGDLRGDELDGIAVGDERDDDVGAGGADGMAVPAVLVAEVLADERALPAREAADGEIAAEGVGVAGDAFAWREDEHGVPFRISDQRSAVSDQRSAIRRASWRVSELAVRAEFTELREKEKAARGAAFFFLYLIGSGYQAEGIRLPNFFADFG
jgi:hypothetical protein